ncbi:hypothetical protein DFJ63DRAFT_285760 [Scheffersomyces coipomensis]|uniref:uncharacterized protein n=1 Tax=Scheffersomyces coipomensis TaxID=1788519 RepID=UPI00315D61AF
MHLNKLLILFQIIITYTSLVSGFNFGFSKNYYKKGDSVDLLVNKIESDNTQLPYSYYNLPFVCPPGKNAKPRHLSLGEILRGDRIWESNYELRFGEDMSCMRLCDLISRETGLARADSLIKNGYVVHWSIDSLPGATTFVSNNKNNKYYAAGFPLGFVTDNISYIYNHVMIVIRYHTEANHKHTIVGFEVYPKSVNNEQCPGSSKAYENFALDVKKSKTGELLKQKTIIPYTYSVYWREDNSIDYDSRWDLYYENESTGKNHHIHWLSFTNSIVLLFLLTLIVTVVLLRTLKRDLSSLSPNGTGSSPASSSPTLPLTNTNGQDDSAPWKGLISDVFKCPSFILPLTTLVAAGIQVIVVLIGVIFIFVLNSKLFIPGLKNSTTFFNNHEGALISISIFIFIISGFVSSYIGIILYKFLNNDNINQEYPNDKIIKLSLLFGSFLPQSILIIVFFLNFFVWAKDSSSAIPFGTIIILLLLFFLIECPLGIIGGYYGNKKTFSIKSFFNNQAIIKEASSNKPKLLRRYNSWLLSPIPSIVIFGLIPFGVVFVELLFIFNSLWLEKTTFYYMYGFLFITTVMLIIIIAESTIIAIYISLSVYNNPNWQWLSFRIGSSIGWYIMGYTIYYFTFYLNVNDFVSSLLYFSYMGLACFLICVGFGSVGLITGLIFVKKIFSTIKVD